MQKINKITVIGSGSTYTPELINGFIEYQDKITVNAIDLYDIDDNRLEITGLLAQRMFDRAGISTQLRLIKNRIEAIEGADFIISQIRVGQIPSRIIDERIPLKHGVLGQETVGAGGIFNALRTIPVTLEIAKDVQRYAPEAWFLNFTNPSGIITEALYRHSSLTRVVGLCNVPINSQAAIAKLLGVNREDVWLDWIGLNHLGWIRRVEVNGKNRLSEIIGKISPEPPLDFYERFPFSGDQIKALGLIPTYYLRYYYDTPNIIQEFLKAGKTRGEIVADIEKELLRQYQDPHIDIKPEELKERGGAMYSQAALNLIYSLCTNQQDVQIVIARNNGAIAHLPDDAAVEVPAVVTSGNITPLATGNTPEHIRGLLENVKTSESLAIKAAVTGSIELIIQSLLANPLVPSFAEAQKITYELLNAHQRYLPKFN
jgi:6-phospho-beta-glucosidase